MDALAFAGDAFKIHRRSRAAALGGRLLYFAERIYMWTTLGFKGSPLWAFVITMAFVNGVRGTFAYHRLPPAPTGLPSIEQSFKAMSKSAHEIESAAERQRVRTDGA